MAYLEYNGMKIEYQIVKSKRKTISIRVGKEGVSVHVPQRLSNIKIAKLMETKADWIIKKLEEMQKVKDTTPKVDYCDGTILAYRGKEITLKLVMADEKMRQKNLAKAYREEDCLVLETGNQSPEAIKQLLEQWYRMEAKKRIEECVHDYTNRYDFGKQVNRIVIKDQKSRWGSCSTKCNLNFNFRLIMAPDEILEYVVVHELCHLIHMNHSAEFWRAVERIRPNYEAEREWLRKNEALLTIE